MVSLVTTGGVEGEPVKQDELMLELGAADTIQGFTDNLRGASPGDEKEFKNQASEEDLFTLSDLLGATSGEDVEWEESENVEAAE